MHWSLRPALVQTFDDDRDSQRIGDEVVVTASDSQ
jgi:hypothetical protein